jgi:CheY-like chemotaxis protein
VSSSLAQLTLARVRLFFREPAAVFWTFGFPLLLTVALGIAFRAGPAQPAKVAVVEGPGAAAAVAALSAAGARARALPAAEARQALRSAKADLVVVPGRPRSYEFDPSRQESRAARLAVDDALQRAEGRADATPVVDVPVSEPGSRYIDFLVPGLLGLNMMSSGMWGIGYAIVETRQRKLLKRMAATPMRRSEFLLSFVSVRMLFLLLEVPVVLGFGWLVFSVPVRGSCSSSPRWRLSAPPPSPASAPRRQPHRERPDRRRPHQPRHLADVPPLGVFFSSAPFPDALQPVIKALPLTALNDALRAVMSEERAWPRWRPRWRCWWPSGSPPSGWPSGPSAGPEDPVPPELDSPRVWRMRQGPAVVLVVDDDAAVRRTVQRALAGLRVVEAVTGSEALALVRREPPDVVLLDVLLPDMTGYEVCLRIKEAVPGLPVLLVTGFGELEDRSAGEGAGADGHLAKPFATAELRSRVEILLHRTASP